MQSTIDPLILSNLNNNGHSNNNDDVIFESNDSSSMDSVLYCDEPIYESINGTSINSNNSDECVSPTNWSVTSADSVLSTITNESNQVPRKKSLSSISTSKNTSNNNDDDNKKIPNGKVYSYSANSSPYLNRKNLVSENGSIIWDSDWDWIQMYDKMLRITSHRKVERQCGCQLKRNYDDYNYSYNYNYNNLKWYSSQPKRLVPNKTRLTNNSNNNNNSPNNGHDEVDFKKTNTFKRATSAPPVKRILIPSKLPPSSSINKSSGAADEEMFMNAFEDVPRIQIFSGKDLEKELNQIRETCSNPNAEWEKRIDCLKRFRSLLIAGAHEYDEFYLYLKPLEVPFQTSVKDLRSQVVREACISIAYLSQSIGNKCDKFAAALLPTLIDSIQNSAKIMSSSAVVAIRFVIQYTHTPRLIPIITYNISSKSKEIRKACCEFLDQLLHTWPAHTLEKHVGALQEAIKKGISDANPEARALARKAFWGFADKFKAESDYLLSSLDSNKQRMLQGEQMSNWSSTNSLNKVPTYSKPLSSRTNSISTNGSVESINRHCNNAAVLLNKRSAIPVLSPSPRINSSSRTPQKATSAIDIDAQKRARTKAQSYLNQQPKPFLNSVYSLSNTKKNDTPIIDRNTAARMASSSVMSSASRKNSRVSKSQPGSRSASPSSRINYTGAGTAIGSAYKTPKRSASRDQSPARTATSSRYERKLSSSSITTSRSKSYMNNSWTADKRKISQDNNVDLNNLNSSEMTNYLNRLLKNYQETSQQNIQHKQKSSPSVMQTPYIVKKMAANQNFFDVNEHLNPADIYDSLKKTSDEIQKYSFSLDHDSVLSPINNNNNTNNSYVNGNNVDNKNKIDTLSNISSDSGISQNGDHNRKFHNHNVSSSSKINGYNSMISPTTNGFTNANFLTSFNSPSIDDDTYQQNLLDLFQFTNDSTSDELSSKCKIVYKSLLTRLTQEKNPKMKILILRCMGQLLYKSNKSSFEEFAEQTFHLLMDLVCKDDDKEVVKNAEDTAIYAVYHFETDITFKILQPFMNHEEYCYSIISIKLLTKMIELNSKKETVLELLPELMPPLLQAYDNKESAVRKNAVFCMVAIYVSVGESMNSYLTSLNRTKMKLLKLYIDRTVQSSSSTANS